MKPLLPASTILALALYTGCSLVLDEFRTGDAGAKEDAADGDGGSAGDDGGPGDDSSPCANCGADAHCEEDHCVCDSEYRYCPWSQDWWNPLWPIRAKIVFDASLVQQTLENVPVLVVMDSDWVEYERVKNDGSDLRFVDASGEALNFDLEEWQHGGTSIFWVGMPRISAQSGSEVLWLYYGNADPTGIVSPTAVWDGFYNAVYHLDKGAEDSSARGNHGTVENAASATGRFAGAYRFTPEASNRIEAGIASAEAEQGTFEAWVKYEGAADYPNGNYMIFGMTENYCGSRNWLQLGQQAAEIPKGYRSRYEDYPNCEVDFARVTTGFVHAPGEWHQVAYTWDNNNQKYRIFVDGIPRGEKTTDSPNKISHTAVRIGALDADGSGGWEGIIDEARISGIVRSADWIWFQYCVTAQTCVSYHSGP